MKKIAAFLTAFVLFVVAATSFHVVLGNRLDTNNSAFGTWINTKKDLSYTAVKSNLEEDSFLMLGSSEFHHGNNTPYHPTKVFRSLNMNVMCIGAAQNQSLSHAIIMGAVAPELKTKKAILMLSPSWFSKKGAEGSGFSARFSQSMYEAMLENDKLSDETKDAIRERTETLLKVSPTMLKQAQTGATIIDGGHVSFKEKVDYKVGQWINEEKENISVGSMWKVTREKNLPEYKAGKEVAPPDWDAFEAEADASLKGKMNNDFNMVDKLFNKKVKPTMKDRKNADVNRTYANSPEYGDLKLFLDVCKESDIEVMLVLLPVNGWWYDYTGFPKENRQVVSDEVEKIAKDYDVKLCNFFDQSYTKGFLEDVVHLAGKGWVRTNEEAYKFFKES